MQDQNAVEIEKTGEGYRFEKAMAARDRSFKVMAAIAARIRPGMLEEEGYEIAKAELETAGAVKNWHRPYVRFGRNTLKMYGEPSEPGVRLGSEDVFFLDIGPVFDRHEGDCGDTFVVGSDAEMRRCAEDARVLFARVRDEWKQGRRTGAELYAFADAEARRMGWRLNLDVNGHRLSDFPHQLYFKGAMTDLGFVPQANVWVLEIQIRHPTREFGAFYEDLLF
jgi:Xaa-Pro aminopeptidase